VSVFFQERSSPQRWIPLELRWLSQRIRPLLHWHAASFVCITAGSLLALLTPLVLKWLIDRVIPERNASLLLLVLALIFLSYQGRTALTSFGNLLMLTASQKMSLGLRIDLLRHFDTLSAEYYDTTTVGAVMYPLKEPIDEVAYFGSDLLPAMLRLLLTTGFTLAAMLFQSPVLTMAVVPLIPIFLFTRHRFRKRIEKDANEVQEARLAWSSFLEEHLAAMIPIQLLSQEHRQERRAFQLLTRSVRSQQNLFITGVWFTVSSSLAVALALCAVIAYGGASALRGTLSVGTLVAFYGFVTQLFEPLSGAAELYARTQKTFASVRQVQSAFDLRPTVTDSLPTARLLDNRDAEIEFVDVEFSYARQKSLLRIPDLRIRTGEQVVIGGENGAGKSTLGKLLVRLYDPVRGSIRFGGNDLRSIQLESLRRQVCYLAREPVLFDGTLMTNLRLVRPTATEQDLWEAVETVGLASFVASLPDGLQQRIGPGGCQLSGGERQRLAIARALLLRPRVLILDEATSCLDPSGESFVLDNVRRELCQSTLIVVSHRLSTFPRFERLLFLSAGRIVRDCPPREFVTARTPSTRYASSDIATPRDFSQ
jgi:ABC-type multidrug transport system fused ATPase/permease subunit